MTTTATPVHPTNSAGIQLIAGPRKHTWTILYPSGETVDILESREVIRAKAKLDEVKAAMRSGRIFPPDATNDLYRRALRNLRIATKMVYEAHGLAVVEGTDTPAILTYHPFHERFLDLAA